MKLGHVVRYFYHASRLTGFGEAGCCYMVNGNINPFAQSCIAPDFQERVALVSLDELGHGRDDQL